METLSKSVEEAVRLAGDRQRLTERLERQPFGGDAIRTPWIFGRFLRGGVEVEVANQFARDVTERVAGDLKSRGLAPAVMIVDKDILAGFIERFGQIELPGAL